MAAFFLPEFFFAAIKNAPVITDWGGYNIQPNPIT
jgi:hypothetical protein